MNTPGPERTPNTMLIHLKDTIPDPTERERLNKRLLTHGEETGWWDERGVPAPWPEELHEWPEDPPITIDRSVTLDPDRPPF